MLKAHQNKAIKGGITVYFGSRPSSFYHRGLSARLVSLAVNLDDAANVKDSFPINLIFE